MVSTVTNSTIAELTTGAQAGPLLLIGILVLLALLVQKELASASADRCLQQLSRTLNFGIYPLLFVFLLNVIFKVLEAMR